MTTAYEVAEHVLAKIDEIVQSGDLENRSSLPLPPESSPGTTTSATIQSEARECLKVYRDILDSVNRYIPNEPKEKPQQIKYIEAVPPGSNRD